MFVYRSTLRCAVALLLAATGAQATECVAFLHGLARTPSSMNKIAAEFAAHGYATSNQGYPSREHPIEVLAPLAIEDAIDGCPADSTVHFVTHSLGGILVRYYLSERELDRLGRVVMIAPPNGGSEVVDNWRNVPGFKALNGPAGLQLGTDEGSVPLALGPVDFDVGIIAGTRTFNPILSLSLPNPDDGKVSVARARVDGMTDFITVPHSHPFIMKAKDTIRQALRFIETGRFDSSP